MADDYENDDFNLLSEGDLFYQYDFSYDATLVSDYATFLTATFQQLQFSNLTLTVNYTIRAEDVTNVMGDSVHLSIWNSLSDENPLDGIVQVVSSATGTIVLDSVAEGVYSVTLSIGDDDDLIVWGGFDIDISDDLTIGVGDSMWQFIENDVIVGVRNIPSIYEGEFLLIFLFADDGNYFNFHNNRNFMMIGYGYVYNNACLIALHPNEDHDGEFELSSGNYDVVALIDTNGSREFYDGFGFGSVDMFTPYEVGDPYDIFDIAYDTTGNNNDLLSLDASFSYLHGVSGTVTCPAWQSGGGDIYVLTFDYNPLQESQAEDDGPLSWCTITQPGDYSIPVFQNYSGYVIGIWDVNDSGFDAPDEGEGGPDAGDYIGAYGESFDSLTQVQVLSSGISGIDFTIDILNQDDPASGQ